MKKCKRCGALQEDTHVRCIDCGERLGPPLTKQEEKENDLKVTKKISKLSNKKDYFYVTGIDKMVAVLLMIGAIAFILIKIIYGQYLVERDTYYSIFIIILMAMEAVYLMLPKITWELYKLKTVFSVSNPDDLQPTVLSLYVRRITAYAVFLLSYIYFIVIIIKLVNLQ